MLLMLPLIVFLLPIIVSAILAAPIIRLMFSFMFPSLAGERTQMQSGIGSQLLSFFLYGALFGPKKADTVRDIRLRDEQGQERLVRIVGDLVTGNVNIGDEIVAVGWNKRGTLMFYRGRNLRTNSEILAKRP